MNDATTNTIPGPLKLAIHGEPFVCASGFLCKRWKRYFVYVGTNPLGPRGGHQGHPVRARCIVGGLRSRDDAAEFAAAYLALYRDVTQV